MYSLINGRRLMTRHRSMLQWLPSLISIVAACRSSNCKNMFFSVQSSIHVMDTIAYLKAQTVSQRNASSGCNIMQSSTCAYEPISNCQVNSTYKQCRVNQGSSIIPNVQV